VDPGVVLVRTSQEGFSMFFVHAYSGKPGDVPLGTRAPSPKDALDLAIRFVGEGMTGVTITDNNDGKVYRAAKFDLLFKRYSDQTSTDN
jgi:hypothetical protein